MQEAGDAPLTVGLILLGGLPGAGKSPYVCELKREGWRAFDDFQTKAQNNSSAFGASRWFNELVEALRAGQRCVVADIRVCEHSYRIDADRTIRAAVPDVDIECRLIERDVETCEANIRASNRPAGARLEKLGEYAVLYSAAGATMLPVCKDSSSVDCENRPS